MTPSATMPGRVSKSSKRHHSPVTLSRTLQQTLFNAASGREDYQKTDTLKRPFEEGLPDLISPQKRARLAQNAIGQDIAAGALPSKADVDGIHQPMPARTSTNQGYALYLETFVNPVDSCAVQGDYLETDLETDFDRDSTQLAKGVTAWLDSVVPESEPFAHRSFHCRSDSYIDYHRSQNSQLSPSPDTLFERPQSISSADMANQKKDDGFKIPSLPASVTSSRKRRASSSSRSTQAMSVNSEAASSSSHVSSKSTVENSTYRYTHLGPNNIFIRLPHETLPQDISDLLLEMAKPRKDKKILTPDVALLFASLEAKNSDESEIERRLLSTFFLDPGPESLLDRMDRQIMGKHTVPSVAGDTTARISTPVPDLQYAYNRIKAFGRLERQINALSPEPGSHKGEMIYPFFVGEFKGTGGNMWVATNQCAGGSVSCTNMIESLNARLPDRVVSNASFSIAMNGTEARLHVTWKEGTTFYMQKIKGFLLQDPDHFELLHQYIGNIMDWGLGVRLQSIQSALETL